MAKRCRKLNRVISQTGQTARTCQANDVTLAWRYQGKFEFLFFYFQIRGEIFKLSKTDIDFRHTITEFKGNWMK